MSIESISEMKGLGGGSFQSRGPAAPQDGLLRDTARELEKLFDEFQVLPATHVLASTSHQAHAYSRVPVIAHRYVQSLRNSISTDPEVMSPPKSLLPTTPPSAGVHDTKPLPPHLGVVTASDVRREEHTSPARSAERRELLSELDLRSRELDSMRRTQRSSDALLKAHDSKASR